MKRIVAIAATVLSLAGATASSAQALTPAKVRNSSTTITHVITIIDENHPQGAVTKTSMPYLFGLSRQFVHTTNYSAITHPSLPNYLDMTSGIDTATKDCLPAGCSVPDDNIFNQLSGDWSVWAESMPSPCYLKNYPSTNPLYAPRHTAAPYYKDIAGSVCKAGDVPLDASNPPAISAGYTFVVPNLDNDAHSASLGTADTWLSNFVPKLLSDPAYQDGSTLIELTWDEGNKTSNKVLTVFVNPALGATTLTGAYNHWSLLRLNEELLGLPLLANAASANDIRPALGF